MKDDELGVGCTVRCFAFNPNMQREATIYMASARESNLLNYFFHHVQEYLGRKRLIHF